jgi:hypothetical protein
MTSCLLTIRVNDKPVISHLRLMKNMSIGCQR